MSNLLGHTDTRPRKPSGMPSPEDEKVPKNRKIADRSTVPKDLDPSLEATLRGKLGLARVSWVVNTWV